MPSSGSVDFSVSRDNILYDALHIVGAVGPDDTPASAWITHAARQLNKIVKALGSRGPSLWARKTGYILPVSDTNTVLLGPSGGHATLSYVNTMLSADAAATDLTITVDSITGMTSGDYIGIEQEDGTMQWTTINGAPSGSTVTITAALTAAATEGGQVYTYTTKLQRPLRVMDAFLHNVVDDTDVYIDVVAKLDFDLLGAKTEEGVVDQLSYDPQLTNGVAYIAPRFEDGTRVITIIFQRPFEDFDASGDTPDFPQEWYDYLCLATATRLAPVYGLPSQDRMVLKQEAAEALLLVSGNEPEEGSLRIVPEIE